MDQRDLDFDLACMARERLEKFGLTVEADSWGYRVELNGVFIGGAGVDKQAILQDPKSRSLHGRNAQANARMYFKHGWSRAVVHFNSLSSEERALALATKQHSRQVYEQIPDGAPYIEHVLRVYEAVKIRTADEETRTAALLHDVVEDTPITHEEIEKEFGFYVGQIVRALTRKKNRGEKYSQYVERLCDDPDARLVKECDLEDNLTHLSSAPDSKQSLRHRYEKALEILRSYTDAKR